MLPPTSRSSFWLSHQNRTCFLLLPHSCYMPCPSHPPWLDILIILGEQYKLWSPSLCSFLQPPITSSLFGPNIFLSTLFSNTLNLCSSLNVRDQVSHPYNTQAHTWDVFCGIFAESRNSGRDYSNLNSRPLLGNGSVNIFPRQPDQVTAATDRHATTGEDTADWQDLVRAAVNCKVCELEIAL
jgi:hypothetical protein